MRFFFDIQEIDDSYDVIIIYDIIWIYIISTYNIMDIYIYVYIISTDIIL